MGDLISWTSGAPTTQFLIGADRISQGSNSTRLRVYVQAVNRGSTSSYSNYYGSQTISIDGVWGGASHTGNPFLPRGAAVNVNRWYDVWEIDIQHDVNGYHGAVTFRMQLNYGNGAVSQNLTASFNDFPTIPQGTVPSQPLNLSITKVMPTSFALNFTAPSSNGGNGIDHYIARISKNNPPNVSPYTDLYTLTGTENMFTGLELGTVYYATVYAHNSRGYSTLATPVSARTLSPMRVKVGGVWKYAIPYVKVNGIWRLAEPFVKVSGVWKRTQ
jgi:hypothetical protein